MSALRHASSGQDVNTPKSDGRLGLGSHQASEGLKLRAQLDWACIALRCLKSLPELAGISCRQLAQLNIALMGPCLLDPVGPDRNFFSSTSFSAAVLCGFLYTASLRPRASLQLLSNHG